MKRDPATTARAIIGLIAPAGNGGGGRGMMRGKSEPPSGETDLGAEALDAAAGEILTAIKENDRKALSEALHAAYMACDSMESESEED